MVGGAIFTTGSTVVTGPKIATVPILQNISKDSNLPNVRSNNQKSLKYQKHSSPVCVTLFSDMTNDSVCSWQARGRETTS